MIKKPSQIPPKILLKSSPEGVLEEVLGLFWGVFGALGGSWAALVHLGAVFGRLGASCVASLGALGASWGASWGVLGGPGCVLGTSWGVLGVSWGSFGLSCGVLGLSWGVLRASRRLLGAFFWQVEGKKGYLTRTYVFLLKNRIF